MVQKLITRSCDAARNSDIVHMFTFFFDLRTGFEVVVFICLGCIILFVCTAKFSIPRLDVWCESDTGRYDSLSVLFAFRHRIVVQDGLSLLSMIPPYP